MVSCQKNAKHTARNSEIILKATGERIDLNASNFWGVSVVSAGFSLKGKAAIILLASSIWGNCNNHLRNSGMYVAYERT